MKYLVFYILFLVVAVLIVGVILSLVIGGQLVAPVQRTIGDPPPGFICESVSIPSESGSELSGWLTTPDQAKGSVLLLHGVRADRRSMVPRAQFLTKAGYHTLSIDFQAHGESTGERITLGKLEQQDVRAGVKYLRRRFPSLDIAIIGTSLGGAAALLAEYELPPAAIVVEAVFSDVETAVRNRLEMRMGKLGIVLSPLLTLQIEPRLGVEIEELSPLKQISNLRVPIMLIYGSGDRHAKLSEGLLLFDAANEPKTFWEIEGVAHVDFYRSAESEYEKRVLGFIEKHLEAIP